MAKDNPTTDPKTDPNVILIEGYKDISENLRHYGKMQFAQLTVYVAISAGVLALIAGSKTLEPSWLSVVVEGVAALLGVFFLTMSARVSDYWEKRADQAKNLEALLGFEQYLGKPDIRYMPTRAAVAGVYWTLIIAFVLFAVVDVVLRLCSRS